MARDALAGLRRKLPAEHGHIASAEQTLGGCLIALGRFVEAEPLLTASYERLRAAKGVDAPETRDALERVVELYEGAGGQRVGGAGSRAVGLGGEKE